MCLRNSKKGSEAIEQWVRGMADENAELGRGQMA